MNEKNHAEIDQAMNFKLLPMLAAYVTQTLEKHFGKDEWWQRGVLDVLYEDQKRFLPEGGNYEDLTDSLDLQLCLAVIKYNWRKVFSARLPRNYLSYVEELRMTRNLWAHEPEAFDEPMTLRALDTMVLLSEQFDAETAEELREMWKAHLKLTRMCSH